MMVSEEQKNWNTVDLRQTFPQINRSELDLEGSLRRSGGRELIRRGISVIWAPESVSYSGIIGLHGTSIENLVQIIESGKMLPRTEKTEIHEEDYDDRIYVVPFAEAFQCHPLGDQLTPVPAKKVVNTARSYASMAAFYSYFQKEMPGVIDSINYVATLLMPDSEMAARTITEMQERAVRIGYDEQKVADTFEAAKNRRGAILALGLPTLFKFDYQNGDRTPGREAYIRTKNGLPLEAITGIEIISPTEKQEVMQRL